MKTILRVKNLTKVYPIGERELRALDDVSFSINEGEFLSIMGPSGSGKSTLLYLLGCLDRPSSGSYELDGEEIGSLTSGQLVKIRRHKIGFVFQDFNLLPRLTALKNVELPLIYKGLSSSARRTKAMEFLKAVGLEARAHHKPTQLSGGEKQRVAIARALASDPKIILADEPTGNLDSKTGQEILKLLKQLNEKQHVTIVMITHDATIAKAAERMIRLQDGKLVETKGVLKFLSRN